MEVVVFHWAEHHACSQTTHQEGILCNGPAPAPADVVEKQVTMNRSNHSV